MSNETKNGTLQDLTQWFAEFDRKLEENGGEITDDMALELDAKDAQLSAKCDGYAQRIRMFDAEAKMYDEEVKFFNKKKSVAANKAKRMKTWLHENLQRIGVQKIEGLYKVRRQSNPPRLVIDEIESVPKELTQITITLPMSLVSNLSLSLLDLPVLPDRTWVEELVSLMADADSTLADPTAILKRLKSGEEIPGVHLEVGESLRIA